MEENPSLDNKSVSEGPQAEVLQPRQDTAMAAAQSAAPPAGQKPPGKSKPHTYRPSHKATFIGLAVVAAILLINAAIIGIVIGTKQTPSAGKLATLNISPSILSKLGVNSSTLGAQGVELVVSPNALFNSKLTVAGDVSIAGQLHINSTFNANAANLAQLNAGNTSLSQLQVNGASTLNSLNLKNGLSVSGATQLQGALTVNNILTVNGNLNTSGNLSVGGILSVNTLTAHALLATSSLTIDGHIVTGGSTPSVGPAGSLGSNGTVSISGNDAAGTVTVNAGAGASAGSIASVAFRSQYGAAPRVVITAVGGYGPFYVGSISSSGFTLATAAGLSPGGYSVDYIVEQ